MNQKSNLGQPRRIGQPLSQYSAVDDLNLNRQREINVIKERLKAFKNDSLGAIVYLPRLFSFATQNPSEEILILIRTHWIKNLGWILNNVFYSILPLIIMFFYNLFNLNFEFINTKNIVLVLIAYYLLILTNVLKDFFDWYFDAFIITNERIVEYTFKPFTSYKIQETLLQSLDIVKENAGGLIANIFHYGDILMITEAEKTQFIFKSIPNPTDVRNIVADLTLIAKRYDR